MNNNTAKIPTNMFNQNLHAYQLRVSKEGDVLFYSGHEHAEFNAYTRSCTNTVEGEDIRYAAVLGNQHPGAVLRNLMQPQWKLADLTDFSAFTIGDLVLITETKVYFCINGNVETTELSEKEFEHKRGIVKFPEDKAE